MRNGGVTDASRVRSIQVHYNFGVESNSHILIVNRQGEHRANQQINSVIHIIWGSENDLDLDADTKTVC